ncbi:MAG: PhzF family phenazine biosynthesis protein [Cyclobacteriaceae bacterium]
MTKFSIYQVFSSIDRGLKGNTAAVVHLDNPINKKSMQSLAADLNQPATSFLWEEKGEWNVRWFAPDEEIGLCGHGAFACFSFLKDESVMKQSLALKYDQGTIEGTTVDSTITIKLSAIQSVRQIDPPDPIVKGLGIPILEMYETTNKHLIVIENETLLRSMKPDFNTLRQSNVFGYAVTAPGDKSDFVNRTLVPHVGQLEDHATGSSHAFLTPYWANRLGKKSMKAFQLSKRGGYFECQLEGDFVKLSGGYERIATGMINDLVDFN